MAAEKANNEKYYPLFNEDVDVKASQIIVPQRKKMKIEATKQGLQLVLKHFKMTQNKDIGRILLKHEAHIIDYKDTIYRKAKRDGITANSNDNIRLQIVSDVVEYIYNNTEPPNEYTKKTDTKHHNEVAVWCAKFARNKGIAPPLTLIYAALAHDLERWIPSIKCKYLPESVDKYRKRIIHGANSAKIATYLLKGAPVTKEEIDRIRQLILYHDMPNPSSEVVILGEKILKGANDDLIWELELLMDADSISFFESTIIFFILFKSETNSADWIWERVRNNVKRLRSHLTHKAIKYIKQLPDNLKTKMGVNQKELASLCREYKYDQNESS